MISKKISAILGRKYISTIAIISAVFICYTGMYAIRKSFLVGQYKDLDLGFDVESKVVLVISQVLGYMISKLIGIKIISEIKKHTRTKWLLGGLTFGLLMLGLFAVVPPKLKILALFLNGLPLGMIFGLVFSYIEGRRNTELLSAALSATFIFSTGFVKTVGMFLMQTFGVSEYNMPFLTGALFFPLFLLSVVVLKYSKLPDEHDIKARVERVPMYKKDRIAFLKENGVGFFVLVAIYILLTVARDFRDNFTVEFWAEEGYANSPSILSYTEIPIAVVILLIAASGVLIRNNKLAFNAGVLSILVGALAVLFSTLLFSSHALSPVTWMMISGAGIYLPYILFHCMIFERLVAFLNFKGNVGFLFYMADALGYSGTVLIMILKEVVGFKQAWSSFFITLNIQVAICVLVFVGFTLYYFNRKKTKYRTTPSGVPYENTR